MAMKSKDYETLGHDIAKAAMTSNLKESEALKNIGYGIADTVRYEGTKAKGHVIAEAVMVADSQTALGQLIYYAIGTSLASAQLFRLTNKILTTLMRHSKRFRKVSREAAIVTGVEEAMQMVAETLMLIAAIGDLQDALDAVTGILNETVRIADTSKAMEKIVTLMNMIEFTSESVAEILIEMATLASTTKLRIRQQVTSIE